MPQKLSYLQLELQSDELGFYDESHIQTNINLSYCCQAPVAYSNNECYCSECVETLDPLNDLISETDEEQFMREDYMSSSMALLEEFRDNS